MRCTHPCGTNRGHNCKAWNIEIMVDMFTGANLNITEARKKADKIKFVGDMTNDH